MPLYEYACKSCGKRMELLQRMGDPPPAACPACGGEVKKLISAAAVQFKGSGWYITDYARKGADAAKTESDKGDKSEGADKKAASSETLSGGTDAKASSSTASDSGSSSSAPASTSSDTSSPKDKAPAKKDT